MVGFDAHDRLISTFILTLRELPGVGPAVLRKALIEHKEPIEASDALDESFARGMGIRRLDRGLSREGVYWSDLEERVCKAIEVARGLGVSVLHPYMAEYPQKMLWIGNC